ncbi:hypothetical protein, partial [Klebsiella pneumoniae]|uniref:hypothetical protein n=1 Tax=Klebsiella pneumoniae TaxID=573 RepID=UPI001BB0EFD8
DVTLKMPAFEWVHVQLHQQKGMISLSPPTICNSAVRTTLLDLSTSDNRILITDGYRGSAMNRIPQPETVRPVRSKCDLPCLVLII